MVLVQKWTFFQVFFSGNIGQENVFYKILEEKTPFYAMKRKYSKSWNIDFFPKGLPNGFGPKIAIFPTFFFRQYRQGKCLLRHYKKKKGRSRKWNQEIQKSRKIKIFSKGLTHGFGAKMAIFPSILILGNIGQRNAFYEIIKRKNEILEN